MRSFALTFAVALLLAASAFAQEAVKETAPEVAPVVKEEAAQAKELSIYGEVQAEDATVGSLVVQYYDYDSDEEKKAEIVVAKDAKIENANSVADIKKGDWVDVTYTVAGSKNIAKSVSVEKEEAPEEAGTEAAPAPGTSEDQ